MRPEDLAKALQGLHDWALEHAPAAEPRLPRRLAEHLGTNPVALEVLSEELSSYDHVNLQVALEALAEQPGVALEVVGISLERGFRPGLAELAQGTRGYDMPLELGPVEYAGIDVGDRVVSCIKAGLVLVGEGESRLVLLMSAPDEDEGLLIEAMATSRRYAEEWLVRLRRLMQERNVYRGKVLAFGGGDHPFRPRPLTVRRLPAIPRERIVLPAGTLERIERHTAGFARHAARLRAAGRHLKRGILLHGPPGTGKTLTVMYLAGLMPGRTVVLLAGDSLAGIDEAARLARSLEPAMVVLEDVDLVAMNRMEMPGNPLLFELLNAMEGLDEDADLIFALTTNRPEVLEPALAHRPGRIDLAVELPLPDASARRRLFELYAQGMEAGVNDWAPAVAATDGTSPAFIREVIRLAVLTAAERGAADDRITEDDLLDAIDELKTRSGRLTASLLGATPPPALDLDDDGMGAFDAFDEDELLEED